MRMKMLAAMLSLPVVAAGVPASQAEHGGLAPVATDTAQASSPAGVSGSTPLPETVGPLATRPGAPRTAASEAPARPFRSASDRPARLSGIPDVALSAYQRAAAIINSVQEQCSLDWELLAAIGRVESNHGRHGRSQLDEDGVATPAIIGPRLDGSGNTRAVPDTDAGTYDNDQKWDRAVGPMQFIPSTWRVAGVDGDGDGERDPQNIHDAALAAAVYLCSNGGDLSEGEARQDAVYAYNRSSEYVRLVLAVAASYADSHAMALATDSLPIGVDVSDTIRTRLAGHRATPGIDGSDQQTSTGRTDTTGKNPTATGAGNKPSRPEPSAPGPTNPEGPSKDEPQDPGDDPTDGESSDPSDGPSDEPSDDPSEDPSDDPSDPAQCRDEGGEGEPGDGATSPTPAPTEPADGEDSDGCDDESGDDPTDDPSPSPSP